jgi:predicted nucleic acid-binding protein
MQLKAKRLKEIAQELDLDKKEIGKTRKIKRKRMETNKERIQIIVDSNIIVSLVIKEKSSAYLDIFLKDNFKFFAPEDIIHEFRIHKEELKGKSERFERGIFLAFSFLRIIPREFYRDMIKKAFEICKSFDEKDSPFVGLALKLEAPIWTNDKAVIQMSTK